MRHPILGPERRKHTRVGVVVNLEKISPASSRSAVALSEQIKWLLGCIDNARVVNSRMNSTRGIGE